MGSRFNRFPAADESGAHRLQRLPAGATRSEIEDRAQEADALLLPVAVLPNARRTPHTLLASEFSDFVRSLDVTRPVCPVLEHAGPSAGTWLSERPLGAGAVKDVASGRTPRAATDDDYESVQKAFVAALNILPANLPRFISVDDDGLWMASLSPRTNPEREENARVAQVTDGIRALQDIDPDVAVLLCVDELCPRGIDLTLGLKTTQALIDQGVRWLGLTTGTRALPSLFERPRDKTQWRVWSASARAIVERISRRSEPSTLALGAPSVAAGGPLAQWAANAGFEAVVIAAESEQ